MGGGTVGYKVGGLFNYSVSPVQSGVGVWTLELDWTSTGLPLDNIKCYFDNSHIQNKELEYITPQYKMFQNDKPADRSYSHFNSG